MKPELVIENSSELLADESPVIIPVSIIRFADGKTEVTAYPETEAVVREYITENDDVLKNSALNELCKTLSKTACALGYEPDKQQKHLIFEQTDPNSVSCDIINEQTEIITEVGALKNLTTYRLEKDELCAAVIIDGNIAAISAINSFPEKSRLRELNVQCSPKYRRRGYASSCVALLTRRLLQSGEVDCVRYECRESNRGSVKTALKAGFKLYAEAFYYVCYNK